MAAHIDQATDQVIRNLALQQPPISGAEIHRRLKAGTAGVPAQEKVSKRRVQQIAAEARREAQPTDPLPDDPDSYAALHLKHALVASTREIRRITAKRTKTANDAKVLAEWAKTAAQIRKELGAARARSKSPQHSEAGSTPQRKGTLELLAQTSNGHQAHDTTHGEQDESSREDGALSVPATPAIGQGNGLSSGTDPSSTTTT